MSEKIKLFLEQKFSFLSLVRLFFFFLIWQMSADGVKCEKMHPFPCQRWRFFFCKQGDISRLLCNSGLGHLWPYQKGWSQHHGFVGTIEGHDAMYYLNIVLKWKEWINIPQGTAGWSADGSICSCPSLERLRDELSEEPCSVGSSVRTELSVIALTSDT